VVGAWSVNPRHAVVSAGVRWRYIASSDGLSAPQPGELAGSPKARRRLESCRGRRAGVPRAAVSLTMSAQFATEWRIVLNHNRDSGPSHAWCSSLRSWQLELTAKHPPNPVRWIARSDSTAFNSTVRVTPQSRFLAGRMRGRAVLHNRSCPARWSLFGQNFPTVQSAGIAEQQRPGSPFVSERW
jgi:hypothetical protein